MTDWTIRSAADEDIASVLGLWEQAGGEATITDTHEGLLRLLATDRDALLIVESNGRLVGSLIVAWDGWRGSFYRLAVRPDRRREGIAMALVRAGECHLRERRAVRLTAIVIDDDATALGFWEAAGYQRQPHRARFLRED